LPRLDRLLFDRYKQRMKTQLLLIPLLGALAAFATAGSPERRCGWLQNPTPANWWLVDRDGEWILGVQGGYQAPGMDEMPDMSTRGWVETNGHYGYGCACMSVTTNRRTGRVTRLFSATPVPLRQCRADRRLPRP
jgi:hypothetical protein